MMTIFLPSFPPEEKKKKEKEGKVGNDVNKYCKSVLTDECFNLSCKSRVDYFLTETRL